MADEPLIPMADWLQGRTQPNALAPYATLGGSDIGRQRPVNALMADEGWQTPPDTLAGYAPPRVPPMSHGKGSVQPFAPPLGQYSLLESSLNLPIPVLRNAKTAARLVNALVQVGGRVGSLEAQAWFRGEDSPLGTMYRKWRDFKGDFDRRWEGDQILYRMGADRELRHRYMHGDHDFPISLGPNGEQY